MASRLTSASSRWFSAMSVWKTEWGRTSTSIRTWTAFSRKQLQLPHEELLLSDSRRLCQRWGPGEGSLHREFGWWRWWVWDCDLWTFKLQSSNQNQAKPSKLKIVVENPDDSSFKMEVVTEIEAGPYKSKKIADSDLLLAAMERKIIHFDIIY